MNINKIALFTSLGILALLSLSHLAIAQTVFPTGTTIYKPDGAYSSYILIKWYDEGDERFRPGNILLNARNIDSM